MPNSVITLPTFPYRVPVALIAGVIASTSVQAIDAGSQLRRFQDETKLRMQSDKPGTAPLPQLPSPSQAAAAASTTKTHVAGFEVHGVTRFSEGNYSPPQPPLLIPAQPICGIRA